MNAYTPPQLIPVERDLYLDPSSIVAVADVPTGQGAERVTLVWVRGTGDDPFRVNRPIGEIIDLIAAALTAPNLPDDASELAGPVPTSTDPVEERSDTVVRVCIDCGDAYATPRGSIAAREPYPRCETCRP